MIWVLGLAVDRRVRASVDEGSHCVENEIEPNRGDFNSSRRVTDQSIS